MSWITEWLRLERTSGDHPAQPQVQLEQVAQVCIQVAFEFLQGRKLHSLSGHPVAVLCHPQSKDIFLHMKLDLPVFHFVPIASCLVAEHHWRVCPHPLDTHKCWFLIHIRGQSYHYLLTIKICTLNSNKILKHIVHQGRLKNKAKFGRLQCRQLYNLQNFFALKIAKG